MNTPELTYCDIALLMVMLIGAVLIFCAVCLIFFNIDKVLYPAVVLRRWIRQRIGPPRSVLIAANQHLRENNILLKQENNLLMAENHRLRMLIAKVK